MPIGNYFTARPFDDPSARTLEGDIANVIDAGAGLAAKARPFLKNFVQNLSGEQQEKLGSAMNVLPTSVNLLGRYYTGLGAKNLDFKDEYKQDLGDKVKEAHRMSAFDQFKLREAEKDAMIGIKSAEENLKLIEQGESPTMFGRPLTAQDARMQRTAANNALAQIRSDLRRMEQGDIVFRSEAGTDKSNPLTSTGTSLGSAYFKPNPDGSYTTTDKYDFAYADSDRKAGTPIKAPRTAEAEYRYPDRPSLGYAREAAEAFLGRQPEMFGMLGQKYSMKDIAGAAPATNIGRSLVSRFEDVPFEYSLTVRPK